MPASPAASPGSETRPGNAGSVRIPGDLLSSARLDVFGDSAVGVAVSIGGWLCDLSLAGWTVTANVVQPDDDRPLRILGVRSVSHGRCLPEVLRAHGEAGGALAISSALLPDSPDASADVATVLAASSHSCLWGRAPAASRGLTMRLDRYQPSAAAFAFKQRALAAGGCGAAAVRGEMMLRPAVLPAPGSR